MEVRRLKIEPYPIYPLEGLPEFVERFFVSYNGGRLRDVCFLLREIYNDPETVVGWAISGALTPAGFGTSILAPLIEKGFIDYIVSTGANLYHDLHYSLKYRFEVMYPYPSDEDLKKSKKVRIYDILINQGVFFSTDDFCYYLLNKPEFKGEMATSELHWLMGKYVKQVEDELGVEHHGLLSTAYLNDVPVYCPAAGDGTIGLNIAAKKFLRCDLQIDVARDINEMTAFALYARSEGRKSAVIILGGGTPKNYILQTGPQLQEVMGIKDEGHDFFAQITDARPDTGGLSGATPHEAYTWGKVAKRSIAKNVVCYCDVTVALPIMASYVLSTCNPRPKRRLYRRREECLEKLGELYRAAKEKVG